MTAGCPARVEAGTKAALLDLVDGAVGAGSTTARACSVLELDSRRCRRWGTVEARACVDVNTAGRHRAACLTRERTTPDDRGRRSSAGGVIDRRLPQVRPPRLSTDREPGVGVAVDAVSRSGWSSGWTVTARGRPQRTFSPARPLPDWIEWSATRSGRYDMTRTSPEPGGRPTPSWTS